VEKESVTLSVLADLASSVIQKATQAPAVLFLLDNETDLLFAPLSTEDLRWEILQTLFHYVPPASPLQPLPHFRLVEWPPSHALLFQHLLLTKQPVLLSTWMAEQGYRPDPETARLLLLPLVTQQSVIGLFVLRLQPSPIASRQREDGTLEAEFCEHVEYLAAQMTPALERARTQQIADKADIWVKWFITCKPVEFETEVNQTVEQVLSTYAKHLAFLLNAGVQIWMAHPGTKQMTIQQSRGK
jgi:hypothetical protein